MSAEADILKRFASLGKRLWEFQPAPFPGPARSGVIVETEAELGVTFPWSYRLFLEQFSGGGGPFDIFGVEPQTKPGGRFWYFDSVEAITLSERRDVEPAMPLYLVPFTPDGMGNHWCLDTSQMKEGECPVVFWNHEDEEDQVTVQTHATFLDWLEETTESDLIQEYYQDERNFRDAP
jgi:cell wall assembly regulator SMI1